MGFCKHCQHWEPGVLSRDGQAMGVCHQVNVAGKIIQDTSTRITDETITYTSERFGCIYHRTGPEQVVTIEKKQKNSLQ